MKERVCYWWEAGSGKYKGYCCNGEHFPVPDDSDEDGTYSARYKSYVRDLRRC